MGLRVEDFEIGKAIVTRGRTIGEGDIHTFAGLVGDFTPLHVDEDFSSRTEFGGRIAHGPLTMSAAIGLLTQMNLLDDSVLGLLENWDANFAGLQEIAAFVEKEGLRHDSAKLASLHALPPVRRPGKMFYAAQNFQEHVDEMLRAGMTPAGGPKFTGEKSTSKPYLFLKAPSCLAGANDDIAIPHGLQKIDWEAEIALAIGKGGKRIKAEHALDHVAGFMTTNDVSARDLQIRTDRLSHECR